jgi:HSP20 family molecular chaperone IbpA
LVSGGEPFSPPRHLKEKIGTIVADGRLQPAGPLSQAGGLHMKKDKELVKKGKESATALAETGAAVETTCESPLSLFDLVPLGHHHHHHIYGGSVAGGVCVPAMDIERTENEYIILAEMPGITKKDVSVSIRNGFLNICGRRPEDDDTKDYLLQERSSGTFQRSVALPDGVKSNEAKASFAEGVLKVVLPMCKDSMSGNRQVEVR